jgi:iron complex outermembrane receptor protein
MFVNDVPTKIIPNANVQPEDAREFTAGVVYSPRFVPGLTISTDLFDIETAGWVNPGLDPTQELIRIEHGGALPGESVVRDPNGNLVSITTVAFHNSGTKKARGADFGVAYELQSSVGTFRSTTQATYLDSFEFSAYPGVNESELRSSPTDQFSDDAYLKWKGLSRLEWIWNGLDTALTARYYDGFHEILNVGPQFPNHLKEHWVKEEWLFDLQVSYGFGQDRSLQPNEPRLHDGWPTWRYLLDRTKVTVGINNIFNHDPPRSLDNFPRFIYDPTGRFVYVSVTKKF